MTTRLHSITRLIACVACAAVGGCTSMLPSNKKEVVSSWNSYDEAEKCLATIKPYEATRADVHAAGLDPHLNPSVTVLHYADVLQKFTGAALITSQDVDRGILDCMRAGKRCNGYAVSVKKISQSRTGNFWLDSFNFKRETTTTGWSVDALLLFVDDRMVYELVGGKPIVQEYEMEKNPLGPLQGWANRGM